MAKKTREPVVASIGAMRAMQLQIATALEPLYGPLHRKRIERAIQAELAELHGDAPDQKNKGGRPPEVRRRVGALGKPFRTELLAHGRGWLARLGEPYSQAEL